MIRTDISPNEPVGRKWKLLKSAPELSEVDSKFSNDGKEIKYLNLSRFGPKDVDFCATLKARDRRSRFFRG